MRRIPRGLLITALLMAWMPRGAQGWGGEVHRIINRAATANLPAELAGFVRWADDLERLSMGADERKCCVPGETIKHYIDIDDYPEFFDGSLPRSFDEMVARFGRRRVEGNGTVPWVVDSTLVVLASQLRDADWNRGVATAADLGHYVGDSHQPLHLTTNFDGQLTGQRGVHARYESIMTSLHLAQLRPEPRRAVAYVRPLDAVFEWISVVYPGMNLILEADYAAKRAANGNTENLIYYDILWQRTGDATRAWVRDAALAVAGMWITSWRMAGEPALPGDPPTRAPSVAGPRLDANIPNPFNPSTQVRFALPAPGNVRLRVLDARGRLVRTLHTGHAHGGEQSIPWDGRDDRGRPAPSGIYVLHLEQGDRATARAAVLVR